jgi:predicted AAA+ superfamily ATPase
MVYEKKMEKETFVCQMCGCDYTPRQRNSRYCDDCRAKRSVKNTIKAWPNVNLHGGFIGALSELRVAIELMSHGFEVYRNMCAFGSVDIIAYRKDDTIIAIEVTSGFVNNVTEKRYLLFVIMIA